MVKRFEKISLKDQEDILIEFCEAFLSVEDIREAASFLIDLFTKKEIQILVKRIKIAKYLLNGKTYREIEETLKVSHGTVSKISEWLSEGGEGFKLMFERTKKKKTKISPSLREKVKKRYPAYFWPEILIDDIMKTADKKQKEKIKRTIESLNKKSILYKKLKNKKYIAT